MSKPDPYVRDLRMTAATVVTNHIRATWHSSGEALPYSVVEAALHAGSPFLVDAFLIEEAMTAAGEGTRSDPYRHLARVAASGRLHLRTLMLEDDLAAL